MAHDTNPPVRLSFWQRIKEAWPVLLFSFTLIVTGTSGYFDIKMANAENASGVATNQQSIASLAAEMKEEFQKRAMKFLTETEMRNLWKAMEAQQATVEEFEDLLQQLALSDERFNAKIELEVTKLRNEMSLNAAKAQRSLDAQTSVMEQILREVQSND